MNQEIRLLNTIAESDDAHWQKAYSAVKNGDDIREQEVIFIEEND